MLLSAVRGQVIEPETGSQIGVCAECSVRDRDFSEKKLYKCELCGRWFCEKHVRPRTFLIRGVDDIQDFQIPEGLGLNDVPGEKTPEQVTMILGSLPGLTEDFAQQIKDRIRSGKEKQKKWKGEDSHPDFQFTKKWLEELGIEDRKRSILTKRALARMNRYRLAEKAETFNLKKRNLANEAASTEVLKTKRHFPTKEVGFLIALLALAIAFWFLLGLG
jgi:hypothetical protein